MFIVGTLWFLSQLDPKLHLPIDIKELLPPVLGAWISSEATKEEREVKEVKDDIEKLKNVANAANPDIAQEKGISPDEQGHHGAYESGEQ